MWWSHGANAYPKRIVKQAYLERQGILAAVFRLHELCVAKIRYFTERWDAYEPCRYDMRRGFIVVEIWEMEFLHHLPTGRRVDLRSLRRIRDVEDFYKLCRELEAG